MYWGRHDDHALAAHCHPYPPRFAAGTARKTLPGRDPPLTGGQAKAVARKPRPDPVVTGWEVIKYAIGSTARTMRLCVIILVTALAALLVFRFLGNGFWIA